MFQAFNHQLLLPGWPRYPSGMRIHSSPFVFHSLQSVIDESSIMQSSHSKEFECLLQWITGEILHPTSVYLHWTLHLYWPPYWCIISSTLLKSHPVPTCISLMPVMYFWGCPCGVMVKAMDCGIVSEFVLKLHYYVHFRINTLGKGMNPLILPTTG